MLWHLDKKKVQIYFLCTCLVIIAVTEKVMSKKTNYACATAADILLPLPCWKKNWKEQESKLTTLHLASVAFHHVRPHSLKHIFIRSDARGPSPAFTWQWLSPVSTGILSILDSINVQTQCSKSLREVVCPLCSEVESKRADGWVVDGFVVCLTLRQVIGGYVLLQTCS